MLIQYTSDLHLEFSTNREYLLANPILPKGEILILAGDILLFRDQHKHNDFLSFVADNFQTTYWVPGNHEYYSSEMTSRANECKESIRSNVFLVNNMSVVHDETRLVFSTLWSKISALNQRAIQRGLNDFRVIQANGQQFNPVLYNELHRESVWFLKQTLMKPFAGKTVVATHHVPTFKSYPERYKDSILNEAFASELSELILDYQPDYWIYGHHHQPIPQFEIGNTKLLTNQLGYVSYGEHKYWQPAAVIDTSR